MNNHLKKTHFPRLQEKGNVTIRKLCFLEFVLMKTVISIVQSISEEFWQSSTDMLM